MHERRKTHQRQAGHAAEEKISPIAVANTNKRYNLLVERKRTELYTGLASLLLFFLSLVFFLALAQLLMPNVQLNNALFISLNLSLAALFSFQCRFFDITDAQYCFGKAACVGFALWLMQGLIFTMTGVYSSLMHLAAGLFIGITAFGCAFLLYVNSQFYRHKNEKSFFYRIEAWLKRSFDIFISLSGLVMTLPMLIPIMAVIYAETKGAPIYVQERVGRSETLFSMYKLRSMHQNAKCVELRNKQTLYKSKDDPRITGVGRMIRKLSIDELPQLWNVLVGEMSLVGPRPPLAHEYQEMNRYHRQKFRVLPGLTGLWQVTGRVENLRDFNSVAAYDVYYIENWSLFEDFKILIKTVPVVLFQKGAY